ncbi:hypothetical protein L6R50_03010 [Myxococcota bacterium]|nr:hypothetical protein [Myxococcota bacterium]
MRAIPTTMIYLLGLSVSAFGCGGGNGDDDDSAATDDDTADDDTADDDTADDDTSAAPLVTFTGSVLDFGSFATPADVTTLTVAVADPSPAIAGGVPEVLAVGTPDASGAFSISGVDAGGATLGVLLIVDDAADAYVATATGVPVSCYQGLPDGGTCADRTAFAITAVAHGSLVAGLNTAGWVGTSIVDVGSFVGFVQAADGSPLGGATVSGTGSPTVYYADADLSSSPNDAFVTGVDPNVATDAAGGGLFVIPEAGIGSYSVDHPDHSFTSITAGSQPGTILIVAFTAS